MQRRRALWLAVWLAWLAWVVLHAFRIPGDGFVAFDGPLPSAAGGVQALTRAARAIAGAMVVVCAAWGLGSLVVRRVFARTFETATERVSFTLALGFGAVAYALLALAFAHLYRPVVVAVVSRGGMGRRPCAPAAPRLARTAARRMARAGVRAPGVRPRVRRRAGAGIGIRRACVPLVAAVRVAARRPPRVASSTNSPGCSPHLGAALRRGVGSWRTHWRETPALALPAARGSRLVPVDAADRSGRIAERSPRH